MALHLLQHLADGEIMMIAISALYPSLMRLSPPDTHDGGQPPIEGLWVRHRSSTPVISRCSSQVGTNAGRGDGERGRVRPIPDVVESSYTYGVKFAERGRLHWH